MEDKIISILLDMHPETDFSKSSTNLVSDAILDSFDVVQIISELESSFSISISALDILPENFDSVESICNLVKKYIKYSTSAVQK